MTPVRVGRGRVVHVSADLATTVCRPTIVRRLLVSEDAVPDCKPCLRALLGDNR